ncbi:MAG: hypothetical protein ACTSXT_05015 [Candidatus Helarchaeota archaeon]
MKYQSPRKRYSCLDEVLFCQQCGKIVKQGLFNTADYFRCELNHICCKDCKLKFGDECPICKMPLEYEELKTLF